MQNQILEKVHRTLGKKNIPAFSVGDKVSVYVRLKEGDKERTQIFLGVVIRKTPKSGKGLNATFTVRKVSSGIGVERIFSLNAPSLEKIKVESRSKVRKSRLYYLRGLKGKKARLKETGQVFEELIIPSETELLTDLLVVADGQPSATEKEGEVTSLANAANVQDVQETKKS